MASTFTGKALIGYGLAKLGPGLLTFASVPIWLSGVGASEYATFSLVWALTLFATSLGLGWIKQASLRTAGDESGALGRLPRWVLVVAVLAPVVPVELWVLATRPHAGWIVLLAAGVFCAANGLYALASTRAQRGQRSGLFAVGEMVRCGAGLLAWAALHWLVGLGGVTSILAGTTLGTLAATALLGASAVPGLMRPRPLPDRRLLAFYWSYGWPMSLWLATSAALLYVDRFCVDIFLGSTAAGRYAAIADMIVRGMGMIAFPVTMAVHPAVMAAWNAGSPEKAKAILRSSGRILMALLTVGVVTGATAGSWIVSKSMQGHAPGGGLVLALAAGAALWQYALLAHKPLEIAGRSVLMLWVIIIAFLLTAGLDVILIPTIGLLGAASALAIGAAGYVIACSYLGPMILHRYTGQPAINLTADRARPELATK